VVGLEVVDLHVPHLRQGRREVEPEQGEEREAGEPHGGRSVHSQRFAEGVTRALDERDARFGDYRTRERG
jgi:hypothetical protein